MKRFIAIIMIIIFAIFPGIDVFAAQKSNTTIAIVSSDTVRLQGKIVNYKGFKISNNNYYKLRDIAESLSNTPSRFDVSWNDKENTVEITTGKEYTPVEELNFKYYFFGERYAAKDTTSKILVDGKLQDIKILPETPEGTYRVELAYETIGDNRLTTRFPRWKSQLSPYIVDNNDGTISIVETNRIYNGEDFGTIT